MIVGPAIVRIEPRLAVFIPIHVEDVRVAIGVRSVQRASQITARVIRPPPIGRGKLAEDSGLYFIRDRKSPSALHQVSLFFSLSATALS